MMAMTGGETGLTPEALMQLFNVNSIEALVEALMSMDESARNALLSATEGSWLRAQPRHPRRRRQRPRGLPPPRPARGRVDAVPRRGAIRRQRVG